MGKCLSIPSYIRKPFLIYGSAMLHSEFPYTVYEENFDFLFYQCIHISRFIIFVGNIEPNTLYSREICA
jgi:hypothetical protein